MRETRNGVLKTVNNRGDINFWTSPEELMEVEVKWYRQNGQFSDRITTDSNGNKYVISDWSWNRNNPTRIEYIEAYLPKQDQDILRKRFESCLSPRGAAPTQ